MLKTVLTPTEGRAALKTQRACAMAYHLETGDPVCAFLKPTRQFAEAPRFGIADHNDAGADITEWFTDEIEKLIDFAELIEPHTRPLILPLPDAAIACPHLAGVADELLANSFSCPQEISFEISDATMVNHAAEALILIRAFRRRGFRISIDARRSWQSELPAYAWLMIDTVRIDPASLTCDQALSDFIETASSAGVSVIAMRPAWRDSAYLETFGVEYGVAPRSDA